MELNAVRLYPYLFVTGTISAIRSNVFVCHLAHIARWLNVLITLPKRTTDGPQVAIYRVRHNLIAQ